jgi:hypothetical protein
MKLKGSFKNKGTHVSPCAIEPRHNVQFVMVGMGVPGERERVWTFGDVLFIEAWVACIAIRDFCQEAGRELVQGHRPFSHAPVGGP